MDSSAKALNEAHNVSHSGTLTVTQRHDAFVKEAFIYLLDYFGVQAKADGEFRCFNEITGRAIVTLSYVFRRRFRTFFKNAQINLDDINEFQKILGHFEITRDECYFFSILKKMSHAFEFIIFCLKEGYNYIETAREVFSLDHDTVFFENRGGLDRLNEIAYFISEVGGVFCTVIQEEKPQDIVLRSYVNAVEILERPDGASVIITHRGLLSTMKNDAVMILQNIHDVDPRVVKVFYHTLIPHSSKVFLHPENTMVDYKMNFETEKAKIIDSFHALLKIILGDFEHTYIPASISIKLAGYFVIFRHLTDLISTALESEQPEYEFWRQVPHPPQNCYSSKEYFLVLYDYIQMIKLEQAGNIPRRAVIDALINPSTQDMHIKKIRSVVNANIEQNNYFPLKDGRYVVYTPDCKFDDNTTCIVMVNEHIRTKAREYIRDNTMPIEGQQME